MRTNTDHDGEDQDLLAAAQSVSFAMLLLIDRFCRDNGVSYMLDAGTLLGAVRSGAFIPWDDDIDLVFPRRDFEKLARLSAALPRELCLSHPRERTDEVPRIQLTQSEHGPKGEPVEIDVFIIDNAPGNRVIRVSWAFVAKLLQVLKAATGRIETPGLRGRTLRILSPLANTIGRSRIHHAYRFWTAAPRKRTSVVRVLNHANWHETDVPSWYLGKTRLLPFRGTPFPVPVEAHRYLVTLYGSDYMVPKRTAQTIRHVHRPLKAQIGELSVELS